MTKKSCKGQIFSKLLEIISIRQPKGTLLIDSASYHRSQFVRAKMKEHEITPIYNVRYCPELAAHEIVINLIKSKYKKLRLTELSLGIVVPREWSLEVSLRSLKTEHTENICAHVLKRW